MSEGGRWRTIGGPGAMTIGGRVMRLRVAKGWGPEELARRADVSRTTLHELETRPGRRPRAATIYLLALALGTTVAKLLGLDDVPGFPDQAGALGLMESEAGPVRCRPAPDEAPHHEPRPSDM